MNKSIKIIVYSLVLIVISALMFFAGIFVANTEWFNDTFYVKSRQMQNLEIESLKPYTKAFNLADSQYDRNKTGTERYEHYHEYYLKVVDKIKNGGLTDLEELEKEKILNYIDGYEKRKELMTDILFPRMNVSVQDGGYGTMIGSSYPSAMLEFDRHELITYRFILKNMYFSHYIDDIDAIFEE